MILDLPETGRRRILYLWGLVFLWCGLIFLISAIPDYSGKGLDFDTLSGIFSFLSRKSAHLTEYAVLMALVYEAIRASRPKKPGLHFLASFGGVLLYAGSDEWHQTFVFGRTGTFFDVMVDVTGAALGYLLYKKWVRPHLYHDTKPDQTSLF